MKSPGLTVLLALFLLVQPLALWADECMEGDCDSGIGTGFTDDGLIYAGQWQDGQPNGSGRMHLKDGSVAEGIWKDGQLIGEGKDAVPAGTTGR